MFFFRGIFWEDKGHLQPLLRTKNALYTVHILYLIGLYVYLCWNLHLHIILSIFWIFLCVWDEEVVTGVKWLSKKGWLFLTSSRTFGLGWLSKKCPRLKEVRFLYPVNEGGNLHILLVGLWKPLEVQLISNLFNNNIVNPNKISQQLK